MKRRLFRHPATKDDLVAIHSFIAKDDILAADRVLDAILRTISDIEVSPFACPLYPIEDSDLDGLLRRKVVTEFRRQYLIFYAVTDSEIRVLYIHRGSLPLEQRLENEPERS